LHAQRDNCTDHDVSQACISQTRRPTAPTGSC